MEDLLQRILEFDHTGILIVIFIIAFTPASIVVLIKNAKPWAKLLAHCKTLALVMGVLVLACAVANHLSKWKRKK